MAMHAAVLPSCSHVLLVQQQLPRAPIGSAVSLWGSALMVEYKGQGGGGARRLRSESSWQGMGLGDVTTSLSSVGQKSRRRGIARAEQVEVETTSIATPASAPPIQLNTGGITEVDKDTFWPIVHSAGEKVVVLDMYTQWCGPCKLMLPKLADLAKKWDDVIFLKLDCNKYNKVLAQELEIRVVPTFKIFKRNKLFGKITGAKFPDLVTALENARKS